MNHGSPQMYSWNPSDLHTLRCTFFKWVEIFKVKCAPGFLTEIDFLILKMLFRYILKIVLYYWLYDWYLAFHSNLFFYRKRQNLWCHQTLAILVNFGYVYTYAVWVMAVRLKIPTCIMISPRHTHNIPPINWTSPDVLMISLDVLMVCPDVLMVSPRDTEHPPMYWTPLYRVITGPG